MDPLGYIFHDSPGLPSHGHPVHVPISTWMSYPHHHISQLPVSQTAPQQSLQPALQQHQSPFYQTIRQSAVTPPVVGPLSLHSMQRQSQNSGRTLGDVPQPALQGFHNNVSMTFPFGLSANPLNEDTFGYQIGAPDLNVQQPTQMSYAQQRQPSTAHSLPHILNSHSRPPTNPLHQATTSFSASTSIQYNATHMSHALPQHIQLNSTQREAHSNGLTPQLYVSQGHQQTSSLPALVPDRRRLARLRARRSISGRFTMSDPRTVDGTDDADGPPSPSASDDVHQRAPSSSASSSSSGSSDDASIRQLQIYRGSLRNKMIASRAAIRSLEPVDVDTIPESDRTCVICYNDYGAESPEGNKEIALRLPACKHIFGDQCLKKWLAESDHCPYCRGKLPAEPKHSPSSAQTFMNMMRMRAIAVGEPDISRGSLGSVLMNFDPASITSDQNRSSGERRPPPRDAEEQQRRTRQRRESSSDHEEQVPFPAAFQRQVAAAFAPNNRNGRPSLASNSLRSAAHHGTVRINIPSNSPVVAGGSRSVRRRSTQNIIATERANRLHQQIVADSGLPSSILVRAIQSAALPHLPRGPNQPPWPGGGMI